MTFFLQLVVTGFSLGMMYALIALGFVVIFKCSGAFNIAQGQIVMLGGYLGYTFLVTLHLPVWAAIIAAIAVAVVMGLVIERLALRPLLGQPGSRHRHDDYRPGRHHGRDRHRWAGGARM